MTLTGSGFQAGATVTFGGLAAAVDAASATSITVTAPSRPAGPVDVVVTNPDGQTATLALGFTYVATPAPPPATGVTLAPSIASPRVAGTQVAFVASGTGSTGYQYQFSIQPAGSTPGTPFSVVQDWSARPVWTMPASLVAGTYVIQVSVRTGLTGVDAQASVAYTLLTQSPAPTIASVSPATALDAGGTAATITGTNFQPGLSVLFGPFPQTVVSVTPTAIALTVTPGLAGLVDVVVVNPDNQAATLPGGFTYTLK